MHDVRILGASHFLALSDVVIGDEPVSPLAMLGRLNDAGEIVELHAFLSDEQTLAQVGVTPASTEEGSLNGPA